ncbi:di-trans,poly-cis-decaprenylcistransferase [Sulfurihydrogenibium azorense Az-Fu1]|uniref:Isoprenyl transferase n=1 Tax=Sulfurihydrogenibium azorense (strain DSM 15241 / OCM 825 / Az-Fu1) TaxID=204536 RepID=C1DWX9_SULAA|nr:isoprenyl transferase [Sulfurihydrogenibium azorense]ACN99547.1 di-trans,poly-cis-decaprenylcistransferase [Sulfurihydrogenibium azorense Az-Fu1]
MIENLYKIPNHVAIIMDGNGRWAKRRGLDRVYGHKEGVKAVEKTIKFAKKVGIKYLTLFAFSTENWQRPIDEVNTIMSLLVEYINEKIPMLLENDVKLIFMGRREGLWDSVLEAMEKGERETSQCSSLTVVIALNYSGKAEILDAVNKILKSNVESIDEESFRQFFYRPEIPDPDLLIRTSGEKRISNFLLWQLAYTELYFTDVLWPDFDEEEFLKALYDYQSRERRFGKVLDE